MLVLLPNDVLIYKIFCFVPFGSILNVLLTCKKLYSNISQPVVYGSCNLFSIPVNNLGRFKLIKQLHIGPDYNNGHLNIITKFERLEILYITFWKDLNVLRKQISNLRMIFKKNALNKIKINDCILYLLLMQWRNIELPELQQLEIFRTFDCDNDTLKKFKISAPKIKWIKLHWRYIWVLNGISTNNEFHLVVRIAPHDTDDFITLYQTLIQFHSTLKSMDTITIIYQTHWCYINVAEWLVDSQKIKRCCGAKLKGIIAWEVEGDEPIKVMDEILQFGSYEHCLRLGGFFT